jgi:hypothetical protein
VTRDELLVEAAQETLSLDVLDLPGSPTWTLERLDAWRRRGDVMDDQGGYLIRALVHGLKVGLIRPEQVRAIAWESQAGVELEVRSLLVRSGAWTSFADTIPCPSRFISEEKWRSTPF